MAAARTTRRDVLRGAGGLVVAVLPLRASAAPDRLQRTIAAFTGGVEPREGKVKVDIEILVESGHSVPMTVTVDHPQTQDAFVRAIAVFNEKNPQPDVAVFHLTPRSGRAKVATRIRLSDSQKIVAVAQLSDGGFWIGGIDVVVTLPACIEGN